MKPREEKPSTVYRIMSKETGGPCGSYSRACCDEFDFKSVREARSANCHGMYEDKAMYQIAKYRVVYELVDDDCDNAAPINPRPDGKPWDWDTWGKARKDGYLLAGSLCASFGEALTRGDNT